MENSLAVPQKVNHDNQHVSQQFHSYVYTSKDRKHVFTQMFLTALFIISKTEQQPKSPLTDEWIKIYVHTHNGISVSHKKNEIMPFAATWMDLDIIVLSEIREKQISCDITYMWDLKK